jgi:hypothetical protein
MMPMNLMTPRVLGGLLLAASAALRPAPAQRPDLSGRWSFNVSQSDNPRDRVQPGDSGGDAERGGGRSGGFPRMGGGGGGRGGFGGGRGGRGGLGGGRGGYEGRGGMSDDQRQRMRQTLQLAFRAPGTLTIGETDSTVSFTADTAQAFVLRVDGHKLTQKVDSGGDLEIKGHWQGDDFVVERKVSGGGKVTEDYLRSGDGKQLFVIVSVDLGRRTLDFRRVYDAAGVK